MKPQAAQVRQQQAQARRDRLREVTAQAQMEQVLQQQRMGAGARPGHPAMGQYRMPRDRNHGLITQSEWNELVEKHEDSGKSFRWGFLILVLTCFLVLLFFKYDEEYNLEVPQVESGRGFGGIVSNVDADTPVMSAAELEQYYRTLGVEGRLKPESAAAASEDGHGGEGSARDDSRSAPAHDPDKERRRENYRVRQEIKRAFESHQEQQGQLVHCGRSCEAKNKQVELAYNKLASQVDRELFGVLLDAQDTKSVRSTTPEQLKKKFEEKRELILKTETDEEDRNMALEELKDAYDIIQDADARKYYLLYGAKPPEAMRHVSARHGGWGQEMALGTFKYRLFFMWLDFFHQRIGIWAESVVVLLIIAAVLSRLPAALKQSDQLLNDLGFPDETKAEKPTQSEGGESVAGNRE